MPYCEKFIDVNLKKNKTPKLYPKKEVILPKIRQNQNCENRNLNLPQNSSGDE